MFCLIKPNNDVVRSFLIAQTSAQFSYSEVGLSRNGAVPAGYVGDHNRIQLGSGAETFERAKGAVRQWKMFAMPWVQLCWPDAPIKPDTNVAILISHFGFWSLNAARVVYFQDEHGACEKYGFAYGTLLEHGERGEERFTVEFHTRDESVWYDLFAFSRPRLAARIAYPLSRYLQKRFAMESKLAMKRAVEFL
jgi:uncharacterized protein (UPF0548 family)